MLRNAARRFVLSLAALAGLGGGVFIPYRYARGLAPGDYPALKTIFGRRAEAMAAWIGAMDGFAGALAAIDGAGPERARWDQDWFPALDAAIAYTIVRTAKPARIVEIGSGHSTRFLARAVRDGGFAAAITAIDPAPRAALPAGVAWVAAQLQDAGDAWRQLRAGDVLFVDSSHVLAPGSDVDLILNHILPSLPSGALVHVHDILLPAAYPKAWAWRGYNEQQAVAALLQGGGYEILFASAFARTALAPRLAASVLAGLPRVQGAVESSLWLRKR